MKKLTWLIALAFLWTWPADAQRGQRNSTPAAPAFESDAFQALKWRNIGPFRGGRSVAGTGVPGDPLTYYMGSTGGGVWKSTDAGLSWYNISDGFFETGSIGAISVAESDPNVVYVGTGEHAVRGVMTSHGDGMYKSTDAGATWQKIGLENSRHISAIVIHPTEPDILLVGVQGSLYGPSDERGVYKSTDGGKSWNKVLFIGNHSGISALSMDMNNPRILYASAWEHQRYPWAVRSGGPDSGIYKSTDMGETWTQLSKGLPEEMGKSAVAVSRANGRRVYAVIEAAEGKGGVYRSDNSGESWTQVNKERLNIARSWYYMKIFADPQQEDRVYVLNAPMTKSIDGGKTWTTVSTPHGDNHHLWINPQNPAVMLNTNDGGANISMNGGASWTQQEQQPTAQFYRVIADNRVPYNVYTGQQDNSSIRIASRTAGRGITWKDWVAVAGCESAYLAFDPDNPVEVYGGCYQGIIDRWHEVTGQGQSIKAYPELSLGNVPRDFAYRFNWNAPILTSRFDRQVIFHAGNKVLKSSDKGITWKEISPDLTRNDAETQGPGGYPITNEAAGGENYHTLMYLAESPHREGELWAGSDDGLVHKTTDGGKTWQNVTPRGLPEGIINAIELSPHDPNTAYIAVMRYKFDDNAPYAFKTTNGGSSWTPIHEGIPTEAFVRVVREDPVRPDLLYAGTERGLYLSTNGGAQWTRFQSNLPLVAITDLLIHENDLIASTSGRALWILDDLSALQQSGGKLPEGLALYQPKPVYRLFHGSSSQFVPGLGQNPEQGTTLIYHLPEKAAAGELSLQIFDAKGQLVRTLHNGDAAHKTWAGGPAKPASLKAEKGLNRFNWDFRRDELPAVEPIFVYGNYSGAAVPPGTYTARLNYKGQSQETEIQILADPRIEASPADYMAQYALMLQVEEQISSLHRNLNEMRALKDQLRQRLTAMRAAGTEASLIEKQEAMITAIETWESKLIQPKQETFQDVINFHNQLNSEWMALKAYLDGPYPVVTAGAKKRYQDLVNRMKSALSDELSQLKNQLATLEKEQQQAGLSLFLTPESK